MLDDRDGFMLIRYKVDVPTESWDKSFDSNMDTFDAVSALQLC